VDLGLEGKVAIVNGASQGIGFAIARTLADEGARVAISARREPALGAAYEDIARTAGGELLAIQGDIRRAKTASGSSARRSRISAAWTSWSTTTARRRWVSSRNSMTMPGAVPWTAT